MRPVKVGILAAVVFTLLGHAAWCKTPGTRYDVVARVHVAYNDLDLQSPAGAQTLLERLKRAAYRACGGDPKLHRAYRTRPEKTIKVYEECRADAMKRAVDQINAPLVARMYAEEVRNPASGVHCADRENLAALLRTS